jgi:hypothetical protein
VKVHRTPLSEWRTYDPAMVKEHMWEWFMTETKIHACTVIASLSTLKF